MQSNQVEALVNFTSTPNPSEIHDDSYLNGQMIMVMQIMEKLEEKVDILIARYRIHSSRPINEFIECVNNKRKYYN